MCGVGCLADSVLKCNNLLFLILAMNILIYFNYFLFYITTVLVLFLFVFLFFCTLYFSLLFRFVILLAFYIIHPIQVRRADRAVRALH